MKRLHMGLAGIGLLGGLLVACSEQPDTAVESGLLQFVPADTPYVFVSGRRMPAALRERLADHAALQLAAQRRAFKRLRAQMADSEGSAGVAEAAVRAFPLIDALLAEFEGRENAARLRELGIEPMPRAVYYGIGLLPAARIEITDAAALDAMLDRVETRSGMPAMRGELNGQAYRRIDLGPVDAVLAITPTQLLAGLLPDRLFERDLPLLLGQTQPARNLADSGDMTALKDRHGFGGYGEGFVKLDTLAAILLGRSQGHNAAVAQALGAATAPAPAGCTALIEGLVSGMPRLVVGVSEVDATTLAVRGIWEGSPEVVAYLRRLAAPVPGVGADYAGLLAIGVGVDLPQLRNGIEALLRQVIVQGADCEWVEPAKIEAVIPQLSLVLGPMTAGIKGFNLQLSDLEVDARTLQPTAVEASLLAAVDDPRGVFALGAMFNPALGTLQIPTDGTPVDLPRDLVPDHGTPPLKVAMRDKALLLLAGDAAAANADALLAAPTLEPAPLFAIDYGVRQLVELFGGVFDRTIDQMTAQGETEVADQLAAQLDDFRLQAQLFERLRVTVYANEHGLIMDQVMRLR